MSSLKTELFIFIARHKTASATVNDKRDELWAVMHARTQARMHAYRGAAQISAKNDKAYPASVRASVTIAHTSSCVTRLNTMTVCRASLRAGQKRARISKQLHDVNEGIDYDRIRGIGSAVRCFITAKLYANCHCIISAKKRMYFQIIN